MDKNTNKYMTDINLEAYNFILNEYEFKAVITGKIVGESYVDALENMFIPGMVTEVTKVKLKEIEKIGEKDV